MNGNEEKIETLEQSKQAEQDPTSEQSREGQHPEQPAPSREKGQQDEPPITEGEEELALELEQHDVLHNGKDDNQDERSPGLDTRDL